MNANFVKIRVSIKFIKIRTKYIFDWNSVPCFIVFNVQECWKCAVWDFTAQMVWWYCADAHL